jgi:hypothetical protein
MRDTEGNWPSMLPVVAGTLFQYFKEAAWSILESAVVCESAMLEVLTILACIIVYRND